HGHALVLLQQGRPGQAEPLLRAALEVDRTAGGNDSFAHLESVTLLAQVCAVGRRDDEALLLFRQILVSAPRLAPSGCCARPDGPPVAFWQQLWGLCQMALTLAACSPVSGAAAEFLFNAVLRCRGLGPRGMVLAEQDDLCRQHPGLRPQLE